MVNKASACCFTGHRVIPTSDEQCIRTLLEREIRQLIKQDIIYFICGGALGFDTIAAQTVLKIKKEYSQIKLLLALPCKDQAKGWSTEEKELYASIIK